jgi:hypothetical protein
MALERAPTWMDAYCHKAADDLGYAVLCPRKLPSLIDIIPCKGPAPEEELWGRYCYDYVLDILFEGPPGYAGPFRTNQPTGHLAIWTIAPGSDMYQGGLFACPGGGRREQPVNLGKHSGHWWACPMTGTANLNSGHVAVQWSAGGLIYGISVHGSTDADTQIIRAVFDQLDLIGPRSPLEPPANALLRRHQRRNRAGGRAVPRARTRRRRSSPRSSR